MNSKKYWTVKGDHSFNDRPFFIKISPLSSLYFRKKVEVETVFSP